MKETLSAIVLKNVFKVTFLTIILLSGFYVLTPFIIAILIGAVLAMALSSFVDFFMHRGLSRKASVMVISLSLGLIGFIPATIAFIRGSQMFLKLIHATSISEIAAKIAKHNETFIEHISSVYHLDHDYVATKINSLLTYLVGTLKEMLTHFFGELPYFFMMSLITLVSIMLLLIESDRIKQLFTKYCYFEKNNGERFLHVLRACCREIFFSNIITGMLQASIVSFGALILDVGDFFLIFFVTFIVSFIPVIGAAPVAIFLSLTLFIDSKMGAGITMLVIALVTSVADNLIRPFLGTLGEIKVHPFIGFLAVVGGVIMFGLPGLFIGPLVISVIFGVVPIIIDEFAIDHKNKPKGE